MRSSSCGAERRRRSTSSNAVLPSRRRNGRSWCRRTPACCGRANSITISSSTGPRGIQRGQPPPPEHLTRRNAEWSHIWADDIIAVPDKWEFPWFAAWDLAFHAVATVRVDPQFAKRQVLLLSDGRYMHPVGQLPAYEYAFGDANPPLLAWSAWRVYQLAGQQGDAYDRTFLEQAFHKCIVNFSWWVNRKDVDDNHLFSGGFLGLDNIGVFDRSKPLPGGGHLEQADATAWMAFYATTMLAMAIELAKHDAAYADIAGKFFEHFMAIAWAMNTFRGQGLWDEDDGSYYDRGLLDGRDVPLRIRSMVGLIPLFAAETLDVNRLQRLPQFRERVEWVFENRPQLTRDIACLHGDRGQEKRLLAVPQRERLIRVLRYLLDEAEFLSPYGVRSLSKYHEALPFELQVGGARHQVRYSPGPSESPLFGGNSNWRGPIWFPVNYLLIEALKRHHHFYGKNTAGRVPGRVGPVHDPARGRRGARTAPRAPIFAGTRGQLPVARAGAALSRGSNRRGPRAIPRVLPRRHGPGPRREPPNGLDRAHLQRAHARRVEPCAALMVLPPVLPGMSHGHSHRGSGRGGSG